VNHPPRRYIMWETQIFYQAHPSAGSEYRLSTRGYDSRNYCYKFLTEHKLQGKSHEDEEILLPERKVINKIFFFGSGIANSGSYIRGIFNDRTLLAVVTGADTLQ
jgi:hypothetical protein